MSGAKIARHPNGKPILTRVVVAADVHIYTGRGNFAYRKGDTIDLPPDHAAELLGHGHVELVAAPDTTNPPDSPSAA